MATHPNYCVIMAGGIGSRFWPVSRGARPKQFLDFFGTGYSLLQMTYNRFRKIMPAEHIYVVTNAIYRDMILEQLPELPARQVLLEPTRRNTAPCIAYAVNRIAAVEPNANVIVSPSDHLILKEDAFLDTVQKGFDFVDGHDVLLTLGMKPTRPETGYGYIQMDEGEGVLRKVRTFTEKPQLEMAKVFVESGEFLWNSGIFLWNIPTILSAFDDFLPEVARKFKDGTPYYGTGLEADYINSIFPSCHNISIDYAILEKATNVYVMASDFGWSDLGTWGSLHALSQRDAEGNATLKCEARFYDSHNNVVTLNSGRLAVIQGLDGYIVAESDGVLLICPEKNEQQIRQIVNDITVQFDGQYS